MRRLWLFRAGSVLLSALLVLVIGEIAVRLLIGPPARMLFGFGRPFHDVQTDWDIVYGETERGSRVTCGETEGTDSQRRFVVIGDSFVFGQGVEDCEDFVSRLNGELPYRFSNLGLIGAGIQDYTLVARDLVDEQDLVLLVFSANDVGRMEWDDGLMASLSERSSFAALVRKTYRAIIVRRAIEAWQRAAATGRRGSDKISLQDGRPNNVLSVLENRKDYFLRLVEPEPFYLDAFEQRFDALAALVAGRVGRQRVLVTMVPEGVTISSRLRSFISENGGELARAGEPGKSYSFIRTLAEKHGFRFIDVYEDFLPDGDGLYHPHDLHWTTEGHLRMSEILANALR